MPQLRQDPATREWVVIATDRARRPEEFSRAEAKEPLPAYKEDCPFCRGNEAMTPPEIWADRPGGREPNGPGWTVRVVPNKFAALTPDGDPDEGRSDGFFHAMAGVGSHEVVAEGTAAFLRTVEG
jgi:UDPglucose--hexose-1-phosphate uridylyltransferase